MFSLCLLFSFTNADDSFHTDDVDFDKRGLDRYGFVNTLGKRQEDEILTPKEQYETDITDNDKREDGNSDDSSDNLLTAKRKIDRLMFSSALGKKRSPYYRFAGTLGKRDDTSAEDEDEEKRGVDRMSYFGTLGKRGQLDMKMFHGALGKRLHSSYYGRLGKRLNKFFGNLGKRSPLYKSFMGNLGKRVRYNKSFFGTLGKRGRVDNMYFGRLGKRDVSSARSRRSVNYGWFSGRPARAIRPIYTQTRGIDRFFSNVGLGKRAPDMRFLPTLGKRFFIPCKYNNSL